MKEMVTPQMIGLAVVIGMFIAGLFYPPVLFLLVVLLAIAGLIFVLISPSRAQAHSQSSLKPPAANGSLARSLRSFAPPAQSSDSKNQSKQQQAGRDNVLFVVVVVIGLLILLVTG